VINAEGGIINRLKIYVLM